MHFLSHLVSYTVTAALSITLAVSSLFQPQHHTVVVTQPAPTPRTIAATSTVTKIGTPLKKPSFALAKNPIQKIPSTTPPLNVQQAVLSTPTPLPVTAPNVLPPPSQISSVSTDDINTKLRSSLVNILCTTKAGGMFRPISGSGFIIDTRGIILTNAHVAQFFLLKDYPFPDSVNCVVRTGSPAMAKYNAKLLYIPEAWVRDNAKQLKSTEATGTGENDYAFLEITSTTDGSPLPAQFPAVTLSLDEPSAGDVAVIAGYPAQFLGGTTIQMNLYASSAVTPIQNVYTFDTGTIDVLSVGSTVVSQSGSSGGSVARTTDGAVVGLISTATEGTTTATRDLRAITLAHIDRSLRSFGKGGLVQFLLDGGIAQKAEDFNTIVAPNLTKELTDVLGH